MKKLICAVTVLAVSTAQAATIFVDAANCPGPGDGSVGDPYCSIQDAIDNAVGTDEIVVAAGTYFEMINFLGKAITVRSTDPQDPVVVANTIIDGTGHFHVVQCVSGEGPDTVLEGFVITGGNANSFPDNNFGGGMYNNNSNPTVTNCTFSENSAGDGGGMANDFNSSPTVTNCTFSGNSGNSAGGMGNFEGSSPTVTGCTFTGNASGSFGGGMSNEVNSHPTVINCTFSGNTADFGGGMFNGSSTTVTDCSFCNNDPNDISGGFFDGGGNVFKCVGACCLDDSCIVAFEANCIAAGGTYQGDVTTCEASTCPTPCPADVDGDGTVGINDFLDLLAAWGPCP